MPTVMVRNTRLKRKNAAKYPMTTNRLGPNLVKPSAALSELVAITSATIARNKYKYVIETILSGLPLFRGSSLLRNHLLKAHVSTDWPPVGLFILEHPDLPLWEWDLNACSSELL